MLSGGLDLGGKDAHAIATGGFGGVDGLVGGFDQLLHTRKECAVVAGHADSGDFRSVVLR